MRRTTRRLLTTPLLVTWLGCAGSNAVDPGQPGGAGGGGGGSGGAAGADASGGTGGSAGGDDGGVRVVTPSLHNTVLGRPTDTSIAVSVLAAAAGDSAWIEYASRLDAAGTALVGAATTDAVRSTAGEPIVVEVAGLASDTQYFYRVHYGAGGQGDEADNLHTFRTQRAKGSTFHFGVQGDTHPERANNKMFHAELYTLTMEQVRDRQPDLYFMLGDDFSNEMIIQEFQDANYGKGYKFKKSVEGVAPYSTYQTLAHPFDRAMLTDGAGAPDHNAAYRELREQYLGIMAGSTSLLLVNGNHEEARVAYLGGVFNNASVWAADGRLKYYPLPAPGAFYSVDTEQMTPVNGYPTLAAPDGLLRDYYAFTWGDALFVTIDPYWHAPHMPETTVFNGDVGANGKNANIWDATMGDEQYAWLKQTLETSQAKYKFVFTHHLNGTGRGGASNVTAGEWGASTADFQANRPGWAKPIHQLLADTKVTIFFQAHDHIFAREVVDGVVYQGVPNPGDNSYFAYNCDAYAPSSIAWGGAAGYGAYDPSYSVKMPNTGFLDVTVGPDGVHVQYVRTYRAIDLQTNPNKVFTGREKNGEIAFAYSLPPRPTDDQAKDFVYTCVDPKTTPAGWAYNP